MEAIQLNNLTTENLIGLIFGLKSQLEDLKKWLTPSQKSYFTRKEVAEMLNINLSTLHNWKKEGVLYPVAIGGRIYYKKEDIDNAMIQLN